MKSLLVVLSLVAVSFSAPRIGNIVPVNDNGAVVIETPNGNRAIISAPYGQIQTQYQGFADEDQYQSIVNKVQQSSNDDGSESAVWNILQNTVNRQLNQDEIPQWQQQQIQGIGSTINQRIIPVSARQVFRRILINRQNSPLESQIISSQAVPETQQEPTIFVNGQIVSVPTQSIVTSVNGQAARILPNGQVISSSDGNIAAQSRVQQGAAVLQNGEIVPITIEISRSQGNFNGAIGQKIQVLPSGQTIFVTSHPQQTDSINGVQQALSRKATFIGIGSPIVNNGQGVSIVPNSQIIPLAGTTIESIPIVSIDEITLPNRQVVINAAGTIDEIVPQGGAWNMRSPSIIGNIGVIRVPRIPVVV